VLEHPGSDVTLTIMNKGGDKLFEVSVRHSVSDPLTLVSSHDDIQLAAMVKLNYCGSLLLQHHAYDQGLRARAFRQALPYALRQVVENLIVPNLAYPDPNSRTWKSEPRSYLNQSMWKLKFLPFPGDHIISRMCRLLFDQDVQLCSLPDGIGVLDLPAVAMHAKELKTVCTCKACSNEAHSRTKCLRKLFMEDLCAVVVLVLALSLFDCPESLRIWSFFSLTVLLDPGSVFARSLCNTGFWNCRLLQSGCNPGLGCYESGTSF
jgi:hypothetical protein